MREREREIETSRRFRMLNKNNLAGKTEIDAEARNSRPGKSAEIPEFGASEKRKTVKVTIFGSIRWSSSIHECRQWNASPLLCGG